MRIGLLGAGGIGQALARHAVAAGFAPVLSNSREPQTLLEIVQGLGAGATAGSRRDAALADVCVLAVPWPKVRAALADLPPWNGRILIDATNPMVPPDYDLTELQGRTSSEFVASLAPGARVVKIANTLPRALLAASPSQGGGRRVLFMSGDDASAKSIVRGIVEGMGFAAIDLGGLAAGGALHQVPGGLLTNLNLVKLN